MLEFEIEQDLDNLLTVMHRLDLMEFDSPDLRMAKASLINVYMDLEEDLND